VAAPARPGRGLRWLTMSTIAADASVAVAVTEAIRAGDLDALRRLLREHPDLAAARSQGARSAAELR
jgi:2-oxo-4-hydroxy-4-carboxy--5-ureidoimidazoline (OHCU) decarboxylase